MQPILFLFDFLRRRAFLITWISLVVYIFYNNFEYYRIGRQFYHLRNILGLGLCVSRGTAAVLNISCALVLLPVCKKLNQIYYPALSKLWPRLFFFWLENAKSFHMTVGATIVLFSVIHSSSHFVNIWNFCQNFDDGIREMNFAGHKNESPLALLLTQTGLTGMAMLLIMTGMGATSLRMVRRQSYNVFWFTHQLYLLFLVLLLLHPLSGVLKEEIIIYTADATDASQVEFNASSTVIGPIFTPIKSKTWIWMAFPLTCFFLEFLWRLMTRNRSIVTLKQIEHLPGRLINLTMMCDNRPFRCRAGQYVLLQCLEISLLEWHPFTVVKIPTSTHKDFNVWIRVKGDWTEELEKVLKENTTTRNLNILLDGPFSSPMEGLNISEIAMCVAAGVGITPFVSILHSLFENPRSRHPGRMHLIWIVKYEQEITWLAKLANNTLLKLINANRPDRLNIEFYVTNNKAVKSKTDDNADSKRDHVITFNEKDGFHHVISRHEQNEVGEKVTLLTPTMKRSLVKQLSMKREIYDEAYIDADFRISNEYPLLGCRLRRGRPQWDNIFKYWDYLYPDHHLNLYCCGPKSLTSTLRKKCHEMNTKTNTTFSFINEGFS